MNRNCVPIISSRYLLRTFAVPTKYQLNYMFGFRFKAKPEHVAAKVRRWYGVGVGMVYADGGGGRLGCDAVFWGATRHAASLRPPRNWRIGFKPPYSKREPRRKARRGQSFIGALLTGK